MRAHAVLDPEILLTTFVVGDLEVLWHWEVMEPEQLLWPTEKTWSTSVIFVLGLFHLCHGTP